MRISWWQTVIFSLVVIVLALKLFPSGREMGLFYFKSKEYAQVEKYLRDQFHKDPKDLANAFRYLTTLNENGKFDLFEEEGQKLLAVYPEDLKVLRFMAKFYEDRMMLAKACAQWLKIFELDREDKKVRQKIIAYYQSAKDYKTLIRLYREQVNQDEANANTYYDLARFYSLTDQLKDTRATYEQLAKAYPDDVKAKRKLAELLELMNDIDGALNLYGQIAQQTPKDQNNQAQFLEKLLFYKRQKDAFDFVAQIINQFTSIQPIVQVVSGYAGKWRDQQEWQTMMDMFYQRDSDDPITVRLLAELFYNEKDYEKAISLLAELHDRDYCDYYTHYLMGNTYNFLLNYDEARQQYQLALKHYERSSELYTSLSDKLIKADILRNLGRRNESLLVLNLILKQDPKNVGALGLAAGNYMDSKRIAQAKDLLEKLYSINKDDSEVLRALGELYALLQDYQTAEKVIRRYHEKTGGDYRSYHMYGNVLAKLGDTGGSRRAYLEALRLIRK